MLRPLLWKTSFETYNKFFYQDYRFNILLATWYDNCISIFLKKTNVKSSFKTELVFFLNESELAAAVKCVEWPF